MEIFDQQSGMLIANLSSLQPTFAVSGLDSERLLKIAVMAVNAKGASDRVILEALTLKAAEKRMGKCELCSFFAHYSVINISLSFSTIKCALSS